MRKWYIGKADAIREKHEAILVTSKKDWTHFTHDFKTGDEIFLQRVAFGSSLPEFFSVTEPLREDVGEWLSVQPALRYVELHAADACNLNCRACSHFAPLFPKQAYSEVAQILQDVKELNRLFPYVRHIRILGGEPLLNPHILDVVTGIRQLYRESRLSIVTNGLLLEKLGREFADILVENRAELMITCYPPIKSVVKAAAERFRSWNVPTFVSPETAYFHLFLKEKGESGFSSCTIKGCYFLRNGTLWRCALSALIGVYNNAFSMKFPTEQGIRLTEHENAFSVLSKLSHEGKLCYYCQDDGYLMPWMTTTSPAAEDWIHGTKEHE